MRIPSGVTDQYIYFVAVDATDLKTRETALSGFTVYRSRNGGAAAAYTTPTVNETDATNMPGVYELLLDEDMTIAAGNDSEEVCLHITHASMAPVTRVFELYRSKITAGNTLDVTANGEAGIDLDNTVGTLDAAQIGADAITAAAIATGAVDADALATDAVNEIRDAILPKKNTALPDITFPMVDDTDHVTLETGLTITVDRSIDGGTFASGTGTVAEIGTTGIYQYDASAADVNGKRILFRASATGADDTYFVVETGG